MRGAYCNNQKYFVENKNVNAGRIVSEFLQRINKQSGFLIYLNILQCAEKFNSVGARHALRLQQQLKKIANE